MKKTALITELERPELSESDSLLVAPLQARGITAVAAPWDAETVDWHAFDTLVLRSCWLYHRQIARFRGWLDWLGKEAIPVWNPVPVALWNIDKIYLRDLQQRNVLIPPTVWLEQGETADLAAILNQEGWERAVVKPRISASAFNIWTTSTADASQNQVHFQAMLAERGLMVQQLLPEIAAGEWSLVFFRGEYSHGVLKKPAADNIFVQQRFGGASAAAVPPPYLIAQASNILRRARTLTGHPILYARVDGVEIDGSFILMELELIEPGLFLGVEPQAAERFAEAISQQVKGNE